MRKRDETEEKRGRESGNEETRKQKKKRNEKMREKRLKWVLDQFTWFGLEGEGGLDIHKAKGVFSSRTKNLAFSLLHYVPCRLSPCHSATPLHPEIHHCSRTDRALWRAFLFAIFLMRLISSLYSGRMALEAIWPWTEGRRTIISGKDISTPKYYYTRRILSILQEPLFARSLSFS